jgi:glycosyltransferase involved in cell wall biosynthesis
VRILVVSGIWPPDVGGPASHAPAFAEFLAGHGHAVEVVTTAAATPESRDHPVRWVDRAAPKGLLHARVVRLVAARARAADVVYATSMSTRSAIATALARRPLVVRVAGDVAYERSRRLGLFTGDLVGFQGAGGARIEALRRARTAALGRAKAIVFPSEFLRSLAAGWGLDGVRLEVVPNPAPAAPPLESVAELREALGLAGPTLAFAGRLTAAKSLGVAFRALAELDRVTLLVVGDGEERLQLERLAGELGLDGRVRFLGAQPREQVLRVLRAADAAVLSSRRENFPHVLVEALAVGTPVVATAVGGVPEVVRDGENGLLVQAGDVTALAGAIRAVLEDDALHARLAAGARESVAGLGRDATYGRLEQLLLEARA